MSWLYRRIFLRALRFVRRQFQRSTTPRRTAPQRQPALSSLEQFENREAPNTFFDPLGNAALNGLFDLSRILGNIPSRVAAFNPAPSVSQASALSNKEKTDLPGIWVGQPSEDKPQATSLTNGTPVGGVFAAIRVAGGLEDTLLPNTNTDALASIWGGFNAGFNGGIAVGPAPPTGEPSGAAHLNLGAGIEAVAFAPVNLAESNASSGVVYAAGGIGVRIATDRNADTGALKVKYATDAAPLASSGTGVAAVTLAQPEKPSVASNHGLSASPLAIVNLAPEAPVSLLASGGSGGFISVSTLADTTEGSSSPGLFAVSRGTSGGAVVATYAVTGSAISGTDYSGLSSTGAVAFGLTDTVMYLSFTSIDDAAIEGTESVTVTITGVSDPNYSIGGPATASISDNDFSGGSGGTPFNTPAAPPPGCSGRDEIIVFDGNLNGCTISPESENPVRYADGTVRLTFRDLESTGFGSPWGQTRSWTNGAGYAPNSTYGDGTVVTEHPFLMQVDSVTIVQVSNGTTARYFDFDGSEWKPRFFQKEKLTYDSGAGEYTLTDTTGNRIRFYDFNTALSPLKRGQLKSYTDQGGIVTAVTAHDASGRIAEIQRSQSQAVGSLVESYLYTYTSGGQLESVTLRRQISPAPGVSPVWETVRKVEYSYYDGSTSDGTANDLKMAVIKDAAGNTLDTRYYRYYTGSGTGGYAGGLKFALEPLSFARMAAVTDPLTASDSTLELYADYKFEFDSSKRVTKEVVQGEGCSACTGGLGTYTYSYSASTNPDGYNSWKTKTIETLPDGNTNTVYTNVYGQVMLKVFEDVASGQKWRTYSKYDTTDGRVLFTAMPSAVSGHDETKADLMDFNGTDYVHLRDSEGLVQKTSYYSTTNATETVAGGAAGYIYQTFVQRGESAANAVLQSTREYIARVGPTATIYPVATTTQYRIENDTTSASAQTLKNEYTWFGATTLAQSVTTTLPAVTLAQNGSGVANAATVVNDIFGRPIWMKDEAGFLTYMQYDAATSAPTKVIRDVDTTRTTDFSALPAGWATPSGGGLHLTTAYEVDHLGRTTKTTHPNGNVDYMTYNDAAHEVRMYQGWDATTLRPTGPTVVMREDRAGSYTETLTMSAMPSIGAGRPTGTESISGLQSLSRSHTNKAGQVTETDEYFNLSGLTYSTSTTLGTEGTHFYRTRIAYDNHGQVNRVQTPQGTIYRTVYDGLERPVSEWVGTISTGPMDDDDDKPSSGFWSPTNSADMVKVREYEYDDPTVNGGVGDSNLTKSTEIPDENDLSKNRVARMWFDWRNRAVAVKSGVEASEAASVNRPLVYMNYDNLNQVTQTRVYEADGVTPTVTSGVPDPLAASLLRAKTTNSFDELGRVFRSDTFSVDPSSGAVGANTLHTDMWFDSRGNVVKTLAPGGLVQKATYDGAGRMTVSSLTDGGGDANYADAHNVTGDIVLEQSEPTYDANSNVLLSTTRARFHDATGTGALGTPTSGVAARVSFTANYFDLADRLTASADFGTNGGLTFVRPALAPPRTDFVLVTGYAYDGAGRLRDLTDPAGRVHRKEYDALGRTTKSIENFVDGVVSDRDDKTTTFAYNGAGMTSLTAHLTGGGVQTTEWVYGVSASTGSTIASNDIVGKTRFPDATTGAASSSEQETTTVNALGEVLTVTDRNGSVHTLTRDVLGRVVSDAVTTLGTGVDGAVLRIETAYDDQGNAVQITSYDAASGGSIVNQVQREFNGFGQMITEYQSHSGAVNTLTTPKVEYTYSTPSSTTNHARLTSIKYPSGYVVGFDYATGLNDTISRLSALTEGTGLLAPILESYDYLRLGTVVRRAHPLPNVDLTYIKQAGEQNGDAGDQYIGLDRFYRVTDQRWIGSGIALDRFQYGYDRMGNRLYRDNLVNTAFGELYTYDGFNQLATFQRGTLNPPKNGLLGTASQMQNWDFDALGNWDSVTTSGSTQTRTHNKQNEITSVSGATSPTFDANGNMTTDETGKQFVYDAWNRLVKVKDSGGTTLKTYAYDGRTRRVSETVASTTTDLFYSSQWQVLEEKIGSNTTKRYVWSPVYVDALVLRDRDTNSDGTLDERLWVIQDANFNVTALVDGSGVVVERYVYTPFGVVTVMDASWATLPSSVYTMSYLFQGRPLDSATENYDNRGRWYRPALGRPIQADMLRFSAGDVNFYRWERNGPVNKVDPNGLYWVIDNKDDLPSFDQFLTANNINHALYQDGRGVWIWVDPDDRQRLESALTADYGQDIANMILRAAIDERSTFTIGTSGDINKVIYLTDRNGWGTRQVGRWMDGLQGIPDRGPWAQRTCENVALTLAVNQINGAYFDAARAGVINGTSTGWATGRVVGGQNVNNPDLGAWRGGAIGFCGGGLFGGYLGWTGSITYSGVLSIALDRPYILNMKPIVVIPVPFFFWGLNEAQLIGAVGGGFAGLVSGTIGGWMSVW